VICAPAGRAAARLLGGVTAITGAALLIWPRAIASRFSGGHRPPRNLIVRVLGGRQALQGAAQIVYPAPDLVLAGIAVDAVHAASMIAAAAMWPPYRRAALTSAAIAGLSAATGAAVLVTDRT
jgi:hypothetical protein